MDSVLTMRQRDLILRGLFELTVTFWDDDDLRAEIKDLAGKLGGDRDALFFGAEPPKG
jgi:hypothetical protein